MKLEQQVVSLELAKKLKELGVKQESLFYWGISEFVGDPVQLTLYRNQAEFDEEKSLGKTGFWSVMEVEVGSFKETYSAFTVAELGEMLPLEIRNKKGTWIGNLAYFIKGVGYVEGVQDDGDQVITYLGKEVYFEADTEADARGKMLIYLIENNLWSPNTQE